MKKESSKSVLIGTIKTLSNGSAIVFIENPELVELIEFAESRNHVLYEENLKIKKQDQKQTHINTHHTHKYIYIFDV